MPLRDGRSRKAPKHHIARRQKKVSESVARESLTPKMVRKKLEQLLLPILLGALILPFQMKTLVDTIRVLLKAAARRGSVTSARRTAKRGKSRRQVSRVLEKVDQGRLQRLITHTLRRMVRPWVPKHPVLVAIDLHLVPFVGRSKKKPRQLLRSAAKKGTNRFYGYATSYIAEEDRRLTFSVRAVRKKGDLVGIIERVLNDAKVLNIQVKRLLLDREFYCYEVLEFLRRNSISYLMPVRAGSVMRNKWKKESGRKSFTTTHTLKSEGRELDLVIHVVKRYKKGRRGENGIEVLLYAVGGPVPSPAETRAMYRRRFGIETSYRLDEQVRIRTSSRNPAIRLLYFAIAALIQNEWVILKLTHASERRRGRKGYKVLVELLRFSQLLEMLLRALRETMGEVIEVRARGPPPRFVEIILQGES